MAKRHVIAHAYRKSAIKPKSMRQGFRHLKDYSFVDTTRIFLYLLERRSLRDIFAPRPDLKAVQEGPDDQQYGRPTTYYQQLQSLDLLAAWSAVRVPVLALHGEYDCIMSRRDFELLVDVLNRNTPGIAQLVELPHTGHTFEHHASMQDAFGGNACVR